MNKPSTCSSCPLYSIEGGFIRSEGSGKNGVLLLGDHLDDNGKLVGGAAGYGLTNILHRGGWKRDEFLISSITCCYPPEGIDNHTNMVAIERCSQYLEETIKDNPHIKVIVPMGATALYATLGYSDIKNFHGTVHYHERWGKWIIPTLDPALVMKKGLVEVPTMVFDLTRAMKVRQSLGYHVESVEYIEYPDGAKMEEFVDEYEKALSADPDGTWLSVDIETPNSQSIDEEEREDADPSYTIHRASLAFRPNHAITFPWVEPYISWAKQALSGNGVKVWHNGYKFDIPRLEFNGCKINGLQIDAMLAWHFLYPDLPKGLGYVSPFFTDAEPWKHLSDSNPTYYSAKDADIALRNAKGIYKELVRLGTWDVFVQDFIHLEPVLVNMRETGIGIDESKRSELRAYYENLRDNATSLIQAAVPKHICSWVKEGGYKGKPKEVRSWLKENPDAREEEGWTRFGYERMPTEPGSVCGSGQDTQEGLAQVSVSSEGAWNKRKPFNPNSPAQIIEYITHTYGKSAIPRHKKTNKPTTASEEIERLARAKHDKVLELIVDSGDADAKLSNFINNWKVGPDKRVHTVFTNNPATFRLASKNPNVQNFPHRSEEARRMRQMIVGGDGYEWLIEADYKSIEAILVGWYANDEDYIKLAKLGVHSFLASHILADLGKFDKLDAGLPEADMKAALKEASKIAKNTNIPNGDVSYYDASKVTIHSSNYAVTPFTMTRTYPDVFPTQKDADKRQRFYYDLFPSIERWQNRVVDECYSTSMVKNAFGYRRMFYNAKKWAFKPRTKKWELGWGDDAKKAIGTIPQGSAAAIIRRAMLSEPFGQLCEAKCSMVQIHDSLLCRGRDEVELEWVKVKLREAMVFEIPEMGGLSIPIEIKVGRNWGEMIEL